MKWSQLKSHLQSFLAPSLAGRVALHQARYRYAHEEVGRVWFAVDGQEVGAFATHMGLRDRRRLTDQLMDERDAWGSTAAYTQAAAEVELQAMIDRRLGKRRLRSIRLTSDEHPLVRELYTVRCLAEDVESSTPA